MLYPRGFATSDARKEKMIAAETPALVNSKIPMMMPIHPSCCSS
ncbi:hypothetical protein M2444_005570 [Paenibacillus sp. PastF-3]|nr:hypothetical protein [Paenibacillus sp. PastF-3]